MPHAPRKPARVAVPISHTFRLSQLMTTVEKNVRLFSQVLTVHMVRIKSPYPASQSLELILEGGLVLN